MLPCPLPFLGVGQLPPWTCASTLGHASLSLGVNGLTKYGVVGLQSRDIVVILQNNRLDKVQESQCKSGMRTAEIEDRTLETPNRFGIVIAHPLGIERRAFPSLGDNRFNL